MQNLEQLMQLCGEEAVQQQCRAAAQAASDSWIARPHVADVIAELEAYGAGAELDSCAVLSGLVEDHDMAQDFVSLWVADVCRLLQRNELAQPDFGYQSSAAVAVIQLAKSGRAELSVIATEQRPAGEMPMLGSAQFAAVDRREICLAGHADALIATLPDHEDKGRPSVTHRYMSPGDTMMLSSMRDAKVYDRIAGRLVVLRLARSDADPQPIREIRLSDGALLHQSSGDKRSSCQEVAMALLNRMGRPDAVPAFTEIARTGSDHLRWQAMRHCLAMNVRTGFALLGAMARSVDDPLATPAGALRARLIEQYPELLELEKQLCRIS